MAERLRIWEAALIVALFPCVLFAQSHLSKLQSQFARDGDPVHRAKSMPDLGRAEFQEIEKLADEGQLKEALTVLEEYRDQVQSCLEGLDARGINAEKHPNGYKQLQISVRESLRRLDNLLVGLTPDQQPSFMNVRQNLDEVNRHLIRELFPNQPGKQEPPDTSAG